MWISSPGWRLMVSNIVPLLTFVISAVYQIVHGALFILLGQCFGRPLRVWWRHIDFMTPSEGWSIRRWMRSHEMGCLLEYLLMIGVMVRVIVSWLEGCFCSILSTSLIMKSNNFWYLSFYVVSKLSFIPVSVVIFTNMRASGITLLNWL